MPQDTPHTSGDITITYENDLGGQITIDIDGEDFVISASRVRPRPIVDRAADYIGTTASAVYYHPVDVTIPIMLAPVLGGAFNAIAPQAQRNAQQVLRIAVDALSPISDPGNLRLALQMLLVYMQTDTRGRLALATLMRTVSGVAFTPWVFSFGGRWKIKSRGGRIARSGGLFALSTIGAIYRVCLKIHQRRPGQVLGPYSVLLAMITGEDRIVDLPHELGLDAYFALRNHLRQNPDAIQLEDGELELAQATLSWFFDFIENPSGFVSANHE